MGILQRAAQKSADKFAERSWRDMDRAWVSRDEAPVNHAHLRCTSGREDCRGTLFVTTHQVVWRIHEPGWPEGAGFAVRLEDLRLVGRRPGETEAGVFALGMELRGEVGALLFRPQRPSQASTLFAEEMFESIKDARAARRRELGQDA